MLPPNQLTDPDNTGQPDGLQCRGSGNQMTHTNHITTTITSTSQNTRADIPNQFNKKTLEKITLQLSQQQSNNYGNTTITPLTTSITTSATHTQPQPTHPRTLNDAIRQTTNPTTIIVPVAPFDSTRATDTAMQQESPFRQQHLYNSDCSKLQMPQMATAPAAHASEIPPECNDTTTESPRSPDTCSRDPHPASNSYYTGAPHNLSHSFTPTVNESVNLLSQQSHHAATLRMQMRQFDEEI